MEILYIFELNSEWLKNILNRAVVLVLWSAYSPKNPMIRVGILRRLTVLCKMLFENNENNQNETGFCQMLELCIAHKHLDKLFLRHTASFLSIQT